MNRTHSGLVFSSLGREEVEDQNHR